uniref:Intersectin-2-like n=1 Tax=Gouania willdenowi TaxID=441366 RepID=A0A8C5HJK9_GOUWI
MNLSGVNVWSITPEERGKHDKQFDTLAPILGYVSGEQARKFFLQSGLPASVLADIWNLADMDGDGKMDRLEFSIAMKLIKLKLQGRNLPSALPIIMKQLPASNSGMGSMPNLSVNLPSMSTMSTMPILTPIQANNTMRPMQPLLPTPMSLSLIHTFGNSGLCNGSISLLAPPLLSNNAGRSNSSSTTSLASNSPKTGTNDWAVPQASRLKYRQQFNTLDKLMSGYLSGPQVRNALMASNLTQTQLATIWSLADVNKDGQLLADEFILAMHLVDMAKTGHPLPLTLPQDLVPPSLRGGSKPSELVNGTSPSVTPSLIDIMETEATQKNKISFEDKLKENFARGSAELEKRRLTLEQEQRKEREKRAREEKEAHERREREAREQENRRRLEEERWLERQREMERQRNEERLRELERKEAAKLEMERQRREEWECGRREELSRKREGEQEEIFQLRARKRSLELELEAVGNKHKQISDCLRDAQSKRRIQKAEVDLINQKRDARIAEINTLQLEFEDWQRKLSQLVPEQQKLTEELHNISLKKIHCASFATLLQKGLTCRRLKGQLDILEQETTDKLAQMEQYKKELQVDLDQEKREQEQREQERKEQERREEERREQERREQERREQERREQERREQERREQERREQERREQERREQERREREEEEARQLRLQEERKARLREEEEEREAQARLRAIQEKMQEEERRRAEEAEQKRMREVEEERKQKEMEEEKTRKEEQERKPQMALNLTTYKALYSFVARNADELSIDADCLIKVDEDTVGEPGWLCGSYRGNRGWFPQIYAEKCTAASAIENAPTSHGVRSCLVDAFDTADVHLEEYVALYTYESPEVGDLTFVEGDVVIVTEKEGEWWRGCIGDQTGVFPSNYVRPVEPEASRLGTLAKKPEIAQAVTTAKSPMMHQLGLSPGQLIVVLAKNSTGWWLGELQARGKRRQRGWFHSSHVKLLGPSSCKSSPSPLPVCQVIAMYGYAAANKDELSFSKGQLINILDKTNSDWWKGEAGGVIGLLPTNYVKMTTESDPSQQWCADLMALDTMSPQERKRQGYIHELIQTEETYVEDLELVLEVFYRPMSESGRLTDTEMAVIFVNWRELILCNTKLLKALRVRKKTGGENMPVQLIGDLLASELAHMQPYIRFCSCQLNAAALLQNKTYNTPDFKDFLKKIATNYRCKGMPLSSFLLKPMQRITRYPLLIKNILENTPDGHADRFSLQEALDRAEELCSQVNEGVREKENSDRLEWIQSHVQCEGPIEHLVFNSLTNCLGPRKLLHSGRLSKTKSSRELWGFLFNDFLLLTHSTKPFSSEKLFSFQTSGQLKMYKAPLFLNEVLVKMPPDPSSDEPLFHVSHIDRVYTLKTETLNERTAWVQKIKAASEHFIETEKKKREKAYQARSLKTSGIGRLLVTVIEAQELKACKPNGKSNPYCELTMGAQCYTSRPISDTLSPKWNFNCQFFVNDLYQDVLCITVFEKDQFSPDDFLGRTEVPVATIKKELETKRAANRRLLLHEVPTGEVWVKLDLQLYEPIK